MTRCDCCEALLDRLAQTLEDVAAELWQFTQEEHAVVRQRHLTQHGDMPAPNQLHIRGRVVGAGKGRVVTREVQSPGLPATKWMSVDSISTAHTYRAEASAAHNAP